jgi:phage shock protein E
MGIFSSLFGLGGGSKEVAEAISQGASIVDVRTPAEFSGGHVKGSVNIPLNKIPDNIDRIKKMKGPVVLCCASGGRSGQATDFLRNKGIECMNGGGWMSVNGIVNKA